MLHKNVKCKPVLTKSMGVGCVYCSLCVVHACACAFVHPFTCVSCEQKFFVLCGIYGGLVISVVTVSQEVKGLKSMSGQKFALRFLPHQRLLTNSAGRRGLATRLHMPRLRN